MADIELIIKIDADVYTRLFDNGIQDNEIATDDICEMARALRLGTQLPKGHGDLVDRKSISYENTCVVWNAEQGDILECNAPTVIEADKAESEDKE